MVRRIIPTAERTVTRGGDKKPLTKETRLENALGMTYVHIPVDFQNPTERDFDAFCTALKEASDGPVHMHCIANYRVSAFFYRYRRTVLGMDAARARADLGSGLAT
jgi:protein tyrosine phosphatase (PTP) superfamily phosphohydrolase (DUF442 family)